MAQDLMQYGQMVEDSLRGVVRMALTRAATDGLLGEHHFYIGFKTQHPGVDIPDHLIAQYPDEMTIVIQHKYWGLEVGEDAFEITLSFGGQGQRLYIPFRALTSFLDPSVQFGLQFGQQDGDGKADVSDESASDAVEPAPESKAETKTGDDEGGDGDDGGDNVVTLDQFRKD